ncbi:MAG: ABC transporter ATP-binding protein [Bacteroidia bacterium]|nr:ABC transporter ATP-binding protein [Bacteroidia bacterium]
MNVLSIEQLGKTYRNGVRAIDQVCLEIGNGLFGLLGPNGAGKSSLMKTIVGLQKPDVGRIFFNGEDVVEDPQRIKQQCGFLPQDFGVYPKVSAYDLLMHMALLKGIESTADRQEQVTALLAQVNLYEHRKKELNTFSGGMRQRFGVAQALLGSPRLVILDEPTAGLDPEERHRFNSLLCAIAEDTIVILSTHLVEDVRNLCSGMAVMNSGKVLAQGKPDQLVAELEGRVWQKQINQAEQEQYAHEYHVLSSQFVSGCLHIRVLAAHAPDGFRSVDPMLEDVYFSVLHAQSLVS